MAAIYIYIYINEQQSIFIDGVNQLKFQKLDEKKAIGSESDTKSGAGQARKLRKRCSNLTNTWCYQIVHFYFSFIYVKCQEETNMLYCICDLYEFEKLAKNGEYQPFLKKKIYFLIIYVKDMTSSICQFRLHHFCNFVAYGYIKLIYNS